MPSLSQILDQRITELTNQHEESIMSQDEELEKILIYALMTPNQAWKGMKSIPIELLWNLEEAIQALYRTREATLIMEALIIENEYWLIVSKAFQRGILSLDFEDRITEITELTELTNQLKGEQ